MKSLLSVVEARQQLLASISPVGFETVRLPEASGRVLAGDIVSELDLPLFANSSMDGFALRAEDITTAAPGEPVNLSVVADIPAGRFSPVVIKAGQAARIMTGAPLPEGADAVVPVEATDHYHPERRTEVDAPERVQVSQAVAAGDYVRPKGQDVHKGQVVLRKDTRLRPQDIGLLAMLSISEVSVYRRPRVAMLSTGDELVPIESPLEPGKIHDSNAYTLSACVERDGGNAIYLGIAPDREAEVESLLEQAASSGADLILSSAGVSVGAFDFVRNVVERYGRLQFWRVNMRPGKPLTFGAYHDIPFIGLPGNPVSAFVGYEVFVHPALLKLAGLPEQARQTYRVRLLEEIQSDGRESYLRAVVRSVDGRWSARLTGHQGSGNLLSLVQANALLIIPSGVKSLPAGAEVDAWLLGEVEESVG